MSQSINKVVHTKSVSTSIAPDSLTTSFYKKLKIDNENRKSNTR